MSAKDKLRQRLARPDGVRRIGQALWMMVGEPVQPDRLAWARGPLGPEGDELLWQALLDEGCLEGDRFLLEPHRLSSLLCSLWRGEDVAHPPGAVVWTLPSTLSAHGIEADSYLLAATRLVTGAKARLLIVSPYLEPKGIGRLQGPLLSALGRAVDVTLVSHELEDLASLASAALEPIRRESRGLQGCLKVYSARPNLDVLLHLKVVAVDGQEALLGSANVTGNGFGKNLEAGALLGASAALEIEQVVQAVISQGLVSPAYGRGY
jgi:phosphatidylserine/phosphatidylglycerophosphate/cardiolipin synthase-like enzyme